MKAEVLIKNLKVIGVEDPQKCAAQMLRNKKVIIGGSHTRPLQAFALRECGAKLNPSGRSVTVDVTRLLDKFEDPYKFYNGTNSHNHVTFEKVISILLEPQPWEKGE